MKKVTKMLLVGSAVAVGAAVSSPAFAVPLQAYASGSATTVLMNGASQSLGAEIAGAPGGAFSATGVAVRISPTITAGSAPTGGTGPDLSVNTATALMPNLSVYAGTATLTPSTSASVEAAVATRITTAGAGANFADGISYTRAWKSGLQ